MSGDDGALWTMRHGAVWIQMSSVGVEWTTRLAQMVEESSQVPFRRRARLG